MTFSAGNDIFFAIALMILLLAWCGINQSICSIAMLLFFRVSLASYPIVFTAILNTSLPFISMKSESGLTVSKSL